MLCINCGMLPLAGQVGFSTCDHWVSCQHFKGAGFTCPIHPQQTKALQEKRRQHQGTVCHFTGMQWLIIISCRFINFIVTQTVYLSNRKPGACLSVSYLSRGDADTQPVYCRLLFPLVNLGELSEFQDVWLSSPTQDPLSLSGHILVFFSNRLQMTGGRPARTWDAVGGVVTFKTGS